MSNPLKPTFIETFIKQLKISGNKFFNIKINKTETHFHFHIDDKTIINSKELIELNSYKKQLQTIIQNNNFQLLKDTSNKELSDVKKFSLKYSNDEIFSFVNNKIPKNDKYIWLSALMLREANKKGDRDKVKLIKEQMVINHNQKGRNIANICNAGYLEDYIIPWYKYFIEDNNNSDGFLENYKNIVVDLLFVIFISSNKTLEELQLEIKNKIQTLNNAHMNYLFIHAIGRSNIDKAEKVIKEIKNNLKIKDINKTSTNLTLKVKIFL